MGQPTSVFVLLAMRVDPWSHGDVSRLPVEQACWQGDTPQRVPPGGWHQSVFVAGVKDNVKCDLIFMPVLFGIVVPVG